MTEATIKYKYETGEALWVIVNGKPSKMGVHSMIIKFYSTNNWYVTYECFLISDVLKGLFKILEQDLYESEEAALKALKEQK